MSRLNLIETIKSLNNEDLEWLKTQIIDLQILRKSAERQTDLKQEQDNEEEIWQI